MYSSIIYISLLDKGCYDIVKNHIKKEVSDLQPQPHHLQNTSEGQFK